MRWPVAVLILAALVAGPQPATSQATDDVSIVVLLHHPYPDAADPLGFPFPDGSETGYYLERYRHLDTDRDGFDFPHAVFDGVIPVEGLPDEGQPFAATLTAYEGAYEARVSVEAPVTLEIATQPTAGSVLAAVRVVPGADLAGDRLQLWTALVEDHVFYDGGRLGNGVTDHRFTVRAITDHGVLDLSGGRSVPATITYDLPAAATQAYVVAWLQQDASDGLRFDAHEVVQAAIHPALQAAPTVQSAKAVLMQMYSATWCDPCLFGDLAAEDLADRYGVPAQAGPDEGPDYWRSPPALVVLAAVAGAAAFAIFRLPGGRT